MPAAFCLILYFIIMADISGAIPVIGQMFNAWENEASREYDKNKTRWQQEFQLSENEKDRAWQSQLQLDEFNRQSAWQEKMWNAQNEYNSPLQQINRLQAAGINPVAALYGGAAGGSAGNSQSLPSSPNPSSGSSHSVSSPSSMGYGPLGIASLFSSLAQMKKANADAGVSKAEEERIKAKTKPEVEGVLASAERDRATARAQQEQAALTAITAELQSKFGTDKSVAEINKLVSDSYENYAKGNYDKAQTELTRVTEEIARLDWSYKSESLPTLLTNLKLLGDVYRSESQRNIAQAELSRSEVDVNAEIRQLTFYKRLIEKNNWNIKDATFLAEVRATYDQLKQKGVDLGISEEELNKISTENKWINPVNFVEIVNRSLDALNKAKSLTR